MSLPHIVIIGGGFSGLAAARALADAPARITLVDRRNHHLFQPLLYQVATAALSASDIARPIRRILRHQTNSEVILSEAESIDRFARKVILDDGENRLRLLDPSRAARRIPTSARTHGNVTRPVSRRSRMPSKSATASWSLTRPRSANPTLKSHTNG